MRIIGGGAMSGRDVFAGSERQAVSETATSAANSTMQPAANARRATMRLLSDGARAFQASGRFIRWSASLSGEWQVLRVGDGLRSRPDPAGCERPAPTAIQARTSDEYVSGSTAI